MAQRRKGVMAQRENHLYKNLYNLLRLYAFIPFLYNTPQQSHP